MSLWNSNVGKLEVNKIYTLRKMKIEAYPPEAEHKHLQFIGATSLVTRSELAPFFANIRLSDASWSGEIIGFEEAMVYKSCSKCMKRVVDTCVVCKEAVVPNDFRVSTLELISVRVSVHIRI